MPVSLLEPVVIIGVDGWSHDGEDADHLAHRVREVVGALLGGDVGERLELATHEVRSGRAHTAVSCRVPDAAPDAARPGRLDGLLDVLHDVAGPDGAVVATAPRLPDGLARGHDPGALAGAWAAVTAAATRSSGRLVRYPGVDELRGVLPVSDVVARSVVDEVVVVGGSRHDGTTLVDTRDFVRPVLSAGRVRLLVQPAVGGVMVPFEKENPERCCEDH
ncbi:hypothetical protein [Aquipuribacter sp. MA13-6]|uniref:hypothetical protein n=1 Tax=unclassified Aquipuribacter TaxID=2635084 RepID=UPI003EEE8524